MDWDERFRKTIAAGESWFGREPSAAVLQALDILRDAAPELTATKPDAVDVGAGEGRHSRALAKICGSVTALELSPVAAEHYAECFRDEGIENVHWVCSDY